jgi:hypothetical protein
MRTLITTPVLVGLALLGTVSFAGCGGPVECGELTFTSCSELADAKEQETNDLVRERDLETCFAERCATGDE